MGIENGGEFPISLDKKVELPERKVMVLTIGGIFDNLPFREGEFIDIRAEDSKYCYGMPLPTPEMMQHSKDIGRGIQAPKQNFYEVKLPKAVLETLSPDEKGRFEQVLFFNGAFKFRHKLDGDGNIKGLIMVDDDGKEYDLEEIKREKDKAKDKGVE